MTLARGWLTLAALSLLLPEGDRLGIWLPLHLALAGSVSTAISGAMQNFVLAPTASPAPPARLAWLQLGSITVGAGTIAVSRVMGWEAATAAGGAIFVLGIALLAGIVVRARRRALHGRHGLPIALYLGAAGAMLAGGTLGALVGSNAVRGRLWLGLREAHAAVNLLGWVSLTIGGTLVTFLPTVLRVRMPRWHGWGTAAALSLGLVGIGAGLGADLRAVAGLGGLVYAGGVRPRGDGPARPPGTADMAGAGRRHAPPRSHGVVRDRSRGPRGRAPRAAGSSPSATPASPSSCSAGRCRPCSGPGCSSFR